jgi:selenide,water dikinase
MGPEALAQVLRPLTAFFKPEEHPDLLVGLGADDDASVFRLGEDRALIQTMDFFPPVVDDPRDFGAVAAANAMSDVYAMGGEVSVALNICCFPEDMPLDLLQEILIGGAETVRAAGGVIAGGHTVTDPELKYGLSVLGLIDPRRILTKAGARPGDALVLTKPLGTGITTTALKNRLLSRDEILPTVVSMKRLNRTAARLLQGVRTHACTDVTGFSLLGHGLEIADKSEVALVLHTSGLSFVDHAEVGAARGSFPGGTYRNQKYYECRVRFEPELSEQRSLMLFSPETSGGLLAAVDPADLDGLKEAFALKGEPLWVIGGVREGSGIIVAS